jgi:hypothetical protein
MLFFSVHSEALSFPRARLLSAAPTNSNSRTRAAPQDEGEEREV